HIEILGNDVHHIEQNSAGGSGPGLGANGIGIGVYGTDAKIPIADLVIDGNEVHHLKTGLSESLVVNGNVAGFRVTKNSGRRNTIHVIARNNLVYSCHAAGFSIGGYDLKRGTTEDAVIVNNTLYRNDTWRTGAGEFLMQFYLRNNVFKNNIVYVGEHGKAMT